jgi:hypothetical protein
MLAIYRTIIKLMIGVMVLGLSEGATPPAASAVSSGVAGSPGPPMASVTVGASPTREQLSRKAVAVDASC